MNINKFHNDLLEAVGDSTGATNINEFRVKFVAAMTALQASVPSDVDIEEAIAAKTEIAALTSGSDAAAIVAALKA